ncbi:tetratricopeptide repeat protein [Amycolatopsis sp. 195334CR]|uniref:tetratricopeptide repeat protein n=1 Tax=Amycolatopsis sp. 195334CR TaxID=2814588 RepID=UPI001A8C8AAE|nr:tetratricopeptide repeat protein [Amycolatopsis sp. 195334CR]MBN6034212.1 tetratricopeptide repeat protein [Amycolatopsis sp. 195334CR]
MTDSQNVGNAISGTVAGSVVQAGSIQQVVLSPARQEALPVPRQLPAGLRDFVGREEQLAALDALLQTSESAGGAAVVAVVEGTGGGGKTTVVVQWAHRVQAEFPDGTLFVNLRGYGPSAPLTPEIVLASFLAALGVPEAQIPAELDAQAGLYRSLLAGRRVLVVLDNAGDAAQVRPLLPGASGCMVVVTSRASLTDLVVAVAAHRVDLELFTTAESRDLLRGVVGPARADPEPAAVAELVRLCGGLPLAVRVAATRAAARPRYSLADVVADISEEQASGPGTAFGEGVLGGAVRSVFDWSYSQLSPEQAWVFRGLGLHPGTEFGVDAAAALTRLDPVTVYRCLESLAELHLVEPAGRKRYRMHDLLHTYATFRTELDDTSDDHQEAVRRVLAWYARTAQQADRTAWPALPGVTLGEVAPLGPEVVFTDRAAAMTWLNLERANLISAVRRAAAAGLDVLAMSLAVSCRFLTVGGAAWSSLHLDVSGVGVASAVAVGDQAAEALLLDMQAVTLRQIGRLEEAEVIISRTLTLAEETNDPACLVAGLLGLGRVRLIQGQLQEARERYEQSSSVARETGLTRYEAMALCNLSWISVQLGEFERALEEAERGLQLRRQVDDPIGEVGALVDIALASQGLGRHDDTVSLCRQAIASYQTLGFAGVDLADTFLPLATSLEHLGDLPAAAQALSEAFTVLTALEDPRAAETHARLTSLQTRITTGSRP